MAETGTLNSDVNNAGYYLGVAGTGDDDVIIETVNVSSFNTFTLKSTAGAMDVHVDMGDGNFIGPISIADLGATTSDPVIVTAASRMYGFRGTFQRIQLQQNGGVNVTGAVLRFNRS